MPFRIREDGPIVGDTACDEDDQTGVPSQSIIDPQASHREKEHPLNVDPEHIKDGPVQIQPHDAGTDALDRFILEQPLEMSGDLMEMLLLSPSECEELCKFYKGPKEMDIGAEDKGKTKE